MGHGEYFLATLPDGTRMVTQLRREPRFPMNFGREWVAELLGMSERADWKQCNLGRSGEERLVEDFKSMFQRFDPFAG